MSSSPHLPLSNKYSPKKNDSPSVVIANTLNHQSYSPLVNNSDRQPKHAKDTSLSHDDTLFFLDTGHADGQYDLVSQGGSPLLVPMEELNFLDSNSTLLKFMGPSSWVDLALPRLFLFGYLNRDLESKSTVVGATLNFTNSIIGAGIIGLPYAFMQAGFFFGIILLIFLAFLVVWTVLLLVRCGKMVSKNSYQDLVHAAFNGRGQFLICLFQFIFAFGGMCAYTIIIGDSLSPVLSTLLGQSNDVWYLSRPFLVITTTLLITLPLSMQRDMAALAKTSAVSMISIILILLAVIISASNLPAKDLGNPDMKFTWIGESPAKAIGVISFAFVCHHNTFIIFSSLSTPTLDRFKHVTTLSALISLIACMILAIVGYLTFTDKTQGNVLNNFPEDDLPINFARLAFTLNMFTTFPMELFVARHVAEDYFFPHQPTPKFRHAAWTVGLVLAALVVALGVSDVSIILEVTGGLSATALAYILPPWCWLRLAGSSKLKCWLCIIFGVVVMILSIFA